MSKTNDATQIDGLGTLNGGTLTLTHEVSCAVLCADAKFAGCPAHSLGTAKLAEVRKAVQAMANESGESIQIVAREKKVMRNRPATLTTIETIAPTPKATPSTEWWLPRSTRRF